MKTLKRTIAAILLLALCFSMIACSKQEPDDLKNDQEQSSANSTNSEETKDKGTNNAGSEGTKEEQQNNTVYLLTKVVEKGTKTETVYTAEYDDTGKPLFLKKLIDGEECDTVELKYNDQGLLEYKVETLRQPYLTAITTYQYFYDTNGKVIKEIISDNYGYYMEIEYVHKKNAIERYQREEENGPAFLFSTEYFDDNGQLVSSEVYQEDGTISYKKKYSYNSEGAVISDQWLDENGKQTRLEKYENTYNEDGRLMSATMVQTTGEYHNKPVKRLEWTYDHNGNILTETGFDLLNNPSTDEYAYKREYAYVASESVEERQGHIVKLEDMLPVYVFMELPL